MSRYQSIRLGPVMSYKGDRNKIAEILGGSFWDNLDVIWDDSTDTVRLYSNHEDLNIMIAHDEEGATTIISDKEKNEAIQKFRQQHGDAIALLEMLDKHVIVTYGLIIQWQ